MKEKERYVFIKSTNDELLYILDTDTGEKIRNYPYITKCLNQQDKRIKELEEENQQFVDILEKYGIESVEELDKFIHHKDCQIDKYKQDYENCSKLEKFMSKEHQYCLDCWRATEQELVEIKQKAIVPKFLLGTKLYMIPTVFNGLTKIKDYELLGIDLSSIGVRYDMSVNKKERGISSIYSASEDMFGESIFATLEEAEQKFAEIKGK